MINQSRPVLSQCFEPQAKKVKTLFHFDLALFAVGSDWPQRQRSRLIVLVREDQISSISILFSVTVSRILLCGDWCLLSGV